MSALHFAVWLVTMLQTAGPTPPAEPGRQGLMQARLSRLPVYLVENRDRYPDAVKYFAEGVDKTVFFTEDGITLSLRTEGRGWTVKLDFVGANPEVRLRGEQEQPTVFSYFTGPAANWKTGLPSFLRIAYEELWPGIGLSYRGSANSLKYEFTVAPGADPSRIRLRYRGVKAVSLTASGSLRVQTPIACFEDARPIAWQEVEGKRVPVAVAFALETDTSEIGFRIDAYDTSKPLVVDPAIVVQCGFIGGSGNDMCAGITLDRNGNVFVCGGTTSTNTSFPLKAGPALTQRGNTDAFVAKLDPQGNGLTYCGYIGGSSLDRASRIAVDGSGNAYVTGVTWSSQATFPVTVGPDLTYNGAKDGWVAKVNPAGTALVYCGYIGGGADDAGEEYDIAVNAAGNAYVVGATSNSQATFPVKVGPDLTFNGAFDGFIAKVSVTGQSLDYCGYIGGNGSDGASGVALDSAGYAYVVGGTRSSAQTFPVRVGPDLTFNGAEDAFVAKVRPDGTGLVFCGYIGGIGYEGHWNATTTTLVQVGVALDGANNVYVSGFTNSDEKTFPVKVGPDLTHNGGWDAYVAKVNAHGMSLDYCGYIGGTGFDTAHGIAVDAAGYAYVAGATDSSETTFPVTGGPDLTQNGGMDVFVAKVDPQGNALVSCGFVGGAGDEARWPRSGQWFIAVDLALDAAGNAWVASTTASDQTTLAVTGGPDLTHNGNLDAMVCKVAFAHLQGSGSPRIGSTISFAVDAPGDAGLRYQVGTSLGHGPISIDRRTLGLSPDGLLLVSVSGNWPFVFGGYRGVLDAAGRAAAAIHIPNWPSLVGVRLYSGFVTLDPKAPSGIRSISNRFMFTVTS